MPYTQQTLDELDRMLEKRCQSAKIPGMALIASQDGERIFQKMYGYRDREKRLSVTPDTIFGVASITKSVVALAIMQLEDAGKLTVEDPVIRWLPEFKWPKITYTEHLTIHHLLTHTSGLPGLPAVHLARAASIEDDSDGPYLFGDIPEANQPVESVLDILDVIGRMDFSLLGPPGKVFNYSNEGYALLQEIIERASGMTFTSYMDKQILSPLNMDRSVFLTETLSEKENVTELYAYTKDKERDVFHSPAWWNVGAIYSNGSLKASASDLMTYMDVFHFDGLVGGKRIVSKKSIEKMMTPHVTLPNGAQYGYGLQIHERDGHQFIGHGGSIKGVSSNIQFSKEKGLSVCILMNIADADAEGLAITALDQLSGIKEEETLPEFSMTTEELKQYAGLYQTLEGHEVHVTCYNGRLFIEQDSGSIRLCPCAANEFVMHSGKKVVFTVDAHQDVTGIFRGMRWLPKMNH